MPRPTRRVVRVVVNGSRTFAKKLRRHALAVVSDRDRERVGGSVGDHVDLDQRRVGALSSSAPGPGCASRAHAWLHCSGRHSRAARQLLIRRRSDAPCATTSACSPIAAQPVRIGVAQDRAVCRCLGRSLGPPAASDCARSRPRGSPARPAPSPARRKSRFQVCQCAMGSESRSDLQPAPRSRSMLSRGREREMPFAIAHELVAASPRSSAPVQSFADGQAPACSA